MIPAGAATELTRVALVALGFGALLALAEAWRHFFQPRPEWTRKFVHVSAGLVTAAFPWLFAQPASVLFLGGLFAAILLLSRRKGWLRSLHGVNRRSEGDLYFLLSVALLYLTGRDRPVFYLVAILLLVVSDSLAALLGTSYGRWTYAVEGGRRSFEGSAVFFLTAMLGVHLPLLLLTDIGRAESIVIAVQLALLVTSLEAISLRGSDNLIVPLGAYYLLVKMTPYPASWITLQLGGQLLILALVGLVAWRCRLLTVSGAVTAHLFFYAAWALGGPSWALAPALALAALTAMYRRAQPTTGQPDPLYQVAAVFYVSIVAFVLLFLDDTFQTLLPGPAWLRNGHPFYAPYVGAVAGQLAILAWLQLEAMSEGQAKPGRTWSAGPVAAGLLAFGWVVPLGLAVGPHGLTAAGLLGAALVCWGGLALYALGRRRAHEPLERIRDLRLQACGVAAAAVVALPFLLAMRS